MDRQQGCLSIPASSSGARVWMHTVGKTGTKSGAMMAGSHVIEFCLLVGSQGLVKSGFRFGMRGYHLRSQVADGGGGLHDRGCVIALYRCVERIVSVLHALMKVG